MAQTGHRPKAETFNFRIDPALKSAFAAAAAGEDKPAAQVLRDFMRVYVARRQRRAFDAEAQRQSSAIADRCSDPRTDDYAALAELNALFDADFFASEWSA